MFNTIQFIPPANEQTMIHGYHLILPMYGFRLPNDPRGSWSDFVRNWEIARFGKAKPTANRKLASELTETDHRRMSAAKDALKYPAVSIDGRQALSISNGFAAKTAKSNYTIWACSILPEHTHLVVARHSYKVEQIANLLKGAATKQILDDNLHPLQSFAGGSNRPPRMWSSREWKVYLDSEEAIENAIRYVEENPTKEGKPPQKWSFVTPFGGVSTGGWTVYH